ncbi:MAG: polyphosphate kinase 2 family protein [Isosphaeraceae bacterium]|nr:polyphosphate kinase 2 family protein [Isosphaeraceae bacterium]
MKDSVRFLVEPRSKVKLRDVDPDYRGGHAKPEDAQEEIEHHAQRLRALQELLYAEHQRALLICLQAMDAGGKDGTINHVLGAMNPQGCKVVSFKQPSVVERDHDFLWRVHLQTPGKGEVGVFNRSYYEDVLVTRVHDLVPEKVWSKRYDQINDFEKMLAKNGTLLLKFFLYISKDEQLRRFKDRLDDPTKHWKISASDYTERERWDDYIGAFEAALSRCSTKHAPWFIIPANHKWFRNLAVSRIVVECLEGLNMKYPEPSVDFDQIRKAYHDAQREQLGNAVPGGSEGQG